jgi:hypothetical protein
VFVAGRSGCAVTLSRFDRSSPPPYLRPWTTHRARERVPESSSSRNMGSPLAPPCTQDCRGISSLGGLTPHRYIEISTLTTTAISAPMPIRTAHRKKFAFSVCCFAISGGVELENHRYAPAS